MTRLLLLRAEFAAFQHRGTIYVFALKTGFLTVIGSFAVMLLVLPLLKHMGALELGLAEAIRMSVLFAWLSGIGVSALLALPVGASIHELTVARDLFMDLAHVDPLSGLLNRRGFDAALSEVEGSASLAIFDIDGFKNLNDRFGHPAGDAVIVHVAQVLLEAFPRGRVARVGGEEFAVLVEGELRALRQSKIEHARARFAFRPVILHGQPIIVEISVGMADCDPFRRPEEVYSAADQALYLAKGLGRNRLIHEEDLLQPVRRTCADARH